MVVSAWERGHSGNHPISWRKYCPLPKVKKGRKPPQARTSPGPSKKVGRSGCQRRKSRGSVIQQAVYSQAWFYCHSALDRQLNQSSKLVTIIHEGPHATHREWTTGSVLDSCCLGWFLARLMAQVSSRLTISSNAGRVEGSVDRQLSMRLCKSGGQPSSGSGAGGRYLSSSTAYDTWAADIPANAREQVVTSQARMPNEYASVALVS